MFLRNQSIMNVYVKTFVLILITTVSDSRAQMIGEATQAELGQFNYTVALLYNDEIFCSGALISDRHVLTAAHCLDEHDPKEIWIAAGMVKREVIPQEFRNGKDKYTHKHYKKTSTRPPFDIGILLMDYPVDLREHVDKIRLPEKDVNRGCDLCNITGWGDRVQGPNDMSQVLLWSMATILTDEYCKEFNIRFEPESEFCAVDLEEESRPTKGDSGAPLVLEGYVVGILSGGPPDFEAPIVYTSVWYYKDFIEDVLKKESSNSCDVL